MLMFYTALIEEAEYKSAFEQIYDRHHRQMMHVARRILKNRQDAEDAVQNAFLGIAKTIKTVPVHDHRATKAYALTAAKNAALAILAKRLAHPEPDMPHILLQDDTFEKVVAASNYALLLRCIQQLDPIYRDVLLMIYVYGHSIKEAAVILSRKPETVRKQLCRGRLLLVEICKKEGLL